MTAEPFYWLLTAYWILFDLSCAVLSFVFIRNTSMRNLFGAAFIVMFAAGVFFRALDAILRRITDSYSWFTWLWSAEMLVDVVTYSVLLFAIVQASFPPAKRAAQR